MPARTVKCRKIVAVVEDDRHDNRAGAGALLTLAGRHRVVGATPARPRGSDFRRPILATDATGTRA